MAKSPGRQQEEKDKQEARIAEQAAAQRGPLAPEFSTAVDNSLEDHPPHEQVSRLGGDAAHAEAELQRRQASDFEGQVRPRQRFSAGWILVFVILGILVVAGGVWGIFFD